MIPSTISEYVAAFTKRTEESRWRSILVTAPLLEIDSVYHVSCCCPAQRETESPGGINLPFTDCPANSTRRNARPRGQLQRSAMRDYVLKNATCLGSAIAVLHEALTPIALASCGFS